MQFMAVMVMTLMDIAYGFVNPQIPEFQHKLCYINCFFDWSPNMICGFLPLQVELAHGGRRSSNDARSSYSGGSRGGRDGGDGGGRGRGPSRRSEFRGKYDMFRISALNVLGGSSNLIFFTIQLWCQDYLHLLPGKTSR